MSNMFNCANVPNILNNNYTQAACEMANDAYNFTVTTTGSLKSHMVTQYDKFKGFTSSEPSAEKTSEIYQRVLPGLATLFFTRATLKSACSTVEALLDGKITQSLVSGAFTVMGAALTCASLSYTLDPANHHKFFHS
jgi:hypothetical protein